MLVKETKSSKKVRLPKVASWKMSIIRENVYQPCSYIDDEDVDLVVFHPDCERSHSHRPPSSECDDEKEGFNRRNKARLASFVLLIALLLFSLVGFFAYNEYRFTNNGPLFISAKYTSSDDNEDAPLTPFEEAVTVETSCGKVIGSVEDEAFVFKGIPYAVPPVGDLRWSRPIALWNDPSRCKRERHKHANKFRSPCVQVNPFNKSLQGQEDCLYLNVWTPRIDDTAKLEVMVWVHGGFFQFGSGHEPGLRPSGKLSRKTNMLFVSFNYRLHAMGFLALDLLANSGANSSFGNYGLWDQVIVLEWIQANIHVFGGDPRKVTLFGSDAGAASILTLMTNPDTKQLFRSAWLIGPSMFFNRTFSDAAHFNRNKFLQDTNCSDVACLRSLSATAATMHFFAADDPSFRINDQNDLPIHGILAEQLIVVDGELVLGSLPINESIDCPLLIGSAAQAIEYWPGPRDLRNWSWDQYKRYVSTSLESFGKQIPQLALSLYPVIDWWNSANSTNQTLPAQETTPALQYATMVSDLRQTCPVDSLAAALAEMSNSPVYRYIVNATPSNYFRLYDYDAAYAFHLWDAVAFFDHMEHYTTGATEADYQFRDDIQRLVINFVRENNKEMWQSFPNQTANVCNNVTLIVDYAKSAKCQFWESNGFAKYAWIT